MSVNWSKWWFVQDLMLQNNVLIWNGRILSTVNLNFISFYTDFPAVNWVIQFDCPEDANTYIHRVGRTARFVFTCH